MSGVDLRAEARWRWFAFGWMGGVVVGMVIAVVAF